MTGPLPSRAPAGARIAGDRYQWLVAWQACVTVLHDAATGASNPVRHRRRRGGRGRQPR